MLAPFAARLVRLDSVLEEVKNYCGKILKTSADLPFDTPTDMVVQSTGCC